MNPNATLRPRPAFVLLLLASILLAPAASAGQTNQEAAVFIPDIQVTTYHVRDVNTYFGYCDLSHRWHDVLTVVVYDVVWYLDEDGEYNEDARTGEHTSIEDRITGSCQDVSEIILIPTAL